MILRKFKLLALIDSCEYTLTEIYQGQLYEELQKQLDVTLVTLDEIRNEIINNLSLLPDPKKFDGIYCSIRYRHTFQSIHYIKSYLKNEPVIVNDYDTWVNYIDGSPYKNTYSVIAAALNVKKFFTSTKWWADRLEVDGFYATPLKLGMKPQWIENTKPFADKSRLIEFRGAAHHPRVVGHNKLRLAGLDVPCLPSIKPYSTFLESINDLKVWAHNESEPIFIDTIPHSFNALWPKAIEVLSRGCFVIRDAQEEASWYDMDKIPTAFLFDNVNDAPKCLETILSMPEQERNERIESTIDFLRKQNYWEKYCWTLVETFKS